MTSVALYIWRFWSGMGWANIAGSTRGVHVVLLCAFALGVLSVGD